MGNGVWFGYVACRLGCLYMTTRRREEQVNGGSVANLERKQLAATKGDLTTPPKDLWERALKVADDVPQRRRSVHVQPVVN